ncbi:MAG: transcription antitermination factor NusB, partial [Prevotellaceae bacterium]|nr:transcription antitermination factor NusB [Prevotellaceae bacterium]
ANSDKFQTFLPQFGSEEDKIYAKKLLEAIIEKDSELSKMIDESTKNWEMERIAFMDILIMKMALAEIITFPAIPVNVTLNEYIELAKEYSTEKSSLFINGVLDKIVNELKNDKKFIKVAKFKE